MQKKASSEISVMLLIAAFAIMALVILVIYYGWLAVGSEGAPLVESVKKMVS